MARQSLQWRSPRTCFTKALGDGRDPWLALPEYRTTPVETIGSRPVQRLMARRTKALMPTALTLLHPQVVEGVEKKIGLKRQKAKSYYDRSAYPLPQLEVGQEVRVPPLKKGQSWQAGTLVEQLSDRSFLVKTGNVNIRRNRHVLKPKEQNVPSENAKEQPVAASPDPKGNSPNLYLIQQPVPLLILCLISLLILRLECPRSAPVPEKWKHLRDSVTLSLEL